MKQTYSDILKKTLSHTIELEYYANGVNDDILILWEELGDECKGLISAQNGISTKDAYALVYRMIKEKVESFGTELEERLKEEASAVSTKETEFLSGLYGAALSVGSVSLSKILFTPIDGRDTLQSFVERSKKNILRSYDTALRSGYMFGQSSDSINEQVARNLKQPINGMSSGIKTVIPSFAKQTDRIVFLQNSLEVTWVSTLDGRQCLLCTSLNGTTYKNPSLVPTYPAHDNCRCVIIPSKEIGEKIPTYEEYIESLSDEEQYHVLGKNRYELYKNNQLTLRQFINNGRILRLDELDLPDKEKLLSDNIKTGKLVKELYPNEKFAGKKVSDTSSIYVSTERIKAGIKDPAVYNSDKDMAITLAKTTGKDFYMLSERNIGKKNPDGFFIDSTIGMKHVRGDIDKVGKNLIKALKQSENIFLYVDKKFTEEAVIQKLRGSARARRGGQINREQDFSEPNKNSMIYIYSGGDFYKLKWENIL